MASFKIACDETFKHEGGYANLKGDTGGKTMYGVTHKVARKFGYHGDMRKMTRDFAMFIYNQGYWTPNRLNEIDDQQIANQIFDQAINGGNRSAGKIFQKAINDYNGNKALKIDGYIGKGTVTAYNAVRHKRALLALVIYYRIARYKLVALIPTKRRFLNSWLRRVTHG